MKKKIMIISLLSLMTVSGFAQNTFPTAAGSNVGIGTTTPSTRLQITSATAGTSGLRLTNLTSTTTVTTGNSKALSVDSSGNIILTPVVNTAPADISIFNNDGTLTANRTVIMNAKNLTFTPSTSNSQFFINGTSGYVGLGTLTPSFKLDVSGDIQVVKGNFTNSLPNGSTFTDWKDRNKKCSVFLGGTLKDINDNSRVFQMYDFPQSNIDAKSNVLFGIDDRLNFSRFRMTAETGGTGTLIMLDKSQAEVFKVYDEGNDNTYLQMGKPNSRVIIGGYADFPNSLGHKLFVQGGSAKIEGNILTDSNIGIGTSNFVDGVDVYRLSVKGAVRADRVKVYTSWADFVFEKEYVLPTLAEVEKQIQEKGHLKDIPSAKEVEENGIELGEMNKKLLQKIEELTLYMIEMNKQLIDVKNQIKK